MALLTGGEVAIPNATDTEAADEPAYVNEATVSGGTLLLKVTATSQAGDVAGTFYRCGVAFE